MEILKGKCVVCKGSGREKKHPRGEFVLFDTEFKVGNPALFDGKHAKVKVWRCKKHVIMSIVKIEVLAAQLWQHSQAEEKVSKPAKKALKDRAKYHGVDSKRPAAPQASI